MQHREVMGCESNLFLSYYKAMGLRYVEGGVESSFNTVDRDHHDARLFKCKGDRTVRCFSVADVSNKSMNKSDSFILDKKGVIYVYFPKEKSNICKIKVMEVARMIRDEDYGGKSQVVNVNEDEEGRRLKPDK